MHQDIHGLPISTASQAAAAAFDHAVLGYLKYRADMAARLGAVLAADGEFGLAHCLKGYFALLVLQAGERAGRGRGRAPRARLTATRHAARAGACGGARGLDRRRSRSRDRACGKEILSAHPLDVLAFRLAHFNNFWLGRPARDARVGRAGEAEMGHAI